jgi:hypothetical protein
VLADVAREGASVSIETASRGEAHDDPYRLALIKFILSVNRRGQGKSEYETQGTKQETLNAGQIPSFHANLPSQLKSIAVI